MSDREYMRIYELSNDNITSVTATITTATITTATITTASITTLTYGDTLLTVTGEELNRLDDDHTQENFVGGPACQLRNGGAATGTGGDENLCIMGMNVFEYHILGTQTIIAPVPAATGLNVGLDQTDNDGAEFTMGIDAGAKHAYTIDTDAFYAKWSFTIPVVAGTDDFAVGFRKAEAYQANLIDYTDYAVLNVISGDIKIETDLNNGGTPTVTDTTDNWADAESHSLEVYVDVTGAVTYMIDGAAPTATAAFTFDTTDVVVPFFYYLHANAAQAGAIIWESFECAKTN